MQQEKNNKHLNMFGHFLNFIIGILIIVTTIAFELHWLLLIIVPIGIVLMYPYGYYLYTICKLLIKEVKR